MNGTTITGYLYGDDTYCNDCIHDLFLPYDLVGSVERSTEDVLDEVARRRGIQRQNEDSYSSYQFPHPLRLADTSEADRCALCGRPLLAGGRPL